ncbi:MAG: alpha/beta fold hydrolase [Acidobacteriota bacterium]|nr:alpha/beta fold hydrolase [Acidobacteriota bacterium]
MKRILPALFLITAACGSSSNPNQSATTIQTLTVGNYSAEMGPSPVGVIPAATLHDAERNKDLEVSIEYPTRGGPFPIVVFSPGYGSSEHGYEPLISYWTSNGYVCIRPSHADAGAIPTTPPPAPPVSTASQNRRRGSTQQGTVIPLPPQTNRMEDIYDREREPQWRNRALDIKLVLDSLGDLERQFPELQGKMDHARIGVGGHSYGALTALLLSGMNGTFADPRVKAAVAMSPPGPSESRAITAQSFTSVKVPVMFMTGTNDRGANQSEDANWRKQAFDDSPAGDKYFFLIDSARHSSFTGQVSFYDMTPTMPTTSSSPYYGQQQPMQQQPRGAMVVGNDRRIFQMIKIASLAFWDAYLKSDQTARDLLQPQKFEGAFTGAHITVK